MLDFQVVCCVDSNSGEVFPFKSILTGWHENTMTLTANRARNLDQNRVLNLDPSLVLSRAVAHIQVGLFSAGVVCFVSSSMNLEPLHTD